MGGLAANQFTASKIFSCWLSLELMRGANCSRDNPEAQFVTMLKSFESPSAVEPDRRRFDGGGIDHVERRSADEASRRAPGGVERLTGVHAGRRRCHSLAVVLNEWSDFYFDHRRSPTRYCPQFGAHLTAPRRLGFLFGTTGSMAPRRSPCRRLIAQ